ncbi:hypothetical protein NVV94_02555 [Pseudomonas sp. LS1212]|uniref:hypothetical protein n=1 Tax=Pseudomonas sp. LS1212 TaxID=2972478 RepID=UPI00215BDA68|nr:hypothetical protein [Pseudomonas sp. LS1212]UVJ44508.1 hypothetical protein NVV94_02555 [Pseudomonas sp. LS1212]
MVCALIGAIPAGQGIFNGAVIKARCINDVAVYMDSVQRVGSYMARSRRPIELEDILLQHARTLDYLANDLEAAIGLATAEHASEETQVTELRAAAQALTQRGKRQKTIGKSLISIAQTSIAS